MQRVLSLIVCFIGRIGFGTQVSVEIDRIGYRDYGEIVRSGFQASKEKKKVGNFFFDFPCSLIYYLQLSSVRRREVLEQRTKIFENRRKVVIGAF